MLLNGLTKLTKRLCLQALSNGAGGNDAVLQLVVSNKTDMTVWLRHNTTVTGIL